MLDERQARQLLDAAKAAAQKAYAPYSRFPVGAAILTQNGAVITGANVENASYGLTICAERAAVVRAVSEGQQHFQAVAVWAGNMPNGAVTPCGACRQVLAEFMQAEALVLLADAATPGRIRQLTMASLLPEAFAPAAGLGDSCPHTDSSRRPG
jgi:cytidine deaminase